MKNTKILFVQLLFLILFFPSILLAQAPESMNYQAVILKHLYFIVTWMPMDSYVYCICDITNNGITIKLNFYDSYVSNKYKTLYCIMIPINIINNKIKINTVKFWFQKCMDVISVVIFVILGIHYNNQWDHQQLDMLLEIKRNIDKKIEL